VSQVEPVFCHGPETLSLVKLARRIDETLRRAPEEARARVRADVRAWIERGRSLGADVPPF
jgi:hypothetical protein